MALAMLLNRLRIKLGREPVYKVTVRYTSGAKVTFRCNVFSIGAVNTWSSRRNFRPVSIGWSSIESVYRRDAF